MKKTYLQKEADRWYSNGGAFGSIDQEANAKEDFMFGAQWQELRIWTGICKLIKQGPQRDAIYELIFNGASDE